MPLTMLLCSAAMAQEVSGVVYGGLGPASDDELEVDTLPWSVGVMLQPATSRYVFGFDIAGEGTMLDSTFGDNALRQALSYNLIVGANVATTDTVRFDAGVLLGFRETFADCPDSFLGYQCYADAAPSTEYEANFGVVATASFNRVVVGARATGESVQALVGFRF